MFVHGPSLVRMQCIVFVDYLFFFFMILSTNIVMCWSAVVNSLLTIIKLFSVVSISNKEHLPDNSMVDNIQFSNFSIVEAPTNRKAPRQIKTGE